jgi:uncharacterized cupredoxin-like copper-binding protein
MELSNIRVKISGLMVLFLILSSLVVAQESDQVTEAIPVTINIGEMYFQVEGQDQNAAITLEAGQTYDFLLNNIGKVLHEVQFGRDPNMESGTPHDYTSFLFEGAEVVSVVDKLEVISAGLIEVKMQPGQQMHVQVTLAETSKGDWEIGCFQPGHYEAGMHAPIIVK